MAELRQFKLPDVGEGLTEADIVRWLVAPGDTISINQIIVEIETAKAVVELPSPYQGVVADLLVPEGETAEVGMPIISVQVGSPTSADTARPPVTDSGTAQPPPGQAEDGQVDAGQVADGQVADISAAPADGAVEPGVYGSPAPKAERQAVLVGYGVKLGATKRRPRKAVPAHPAGQRAPRAGAQSAQSAPAAERGSAVPTSKATTVSTATNGSETAVLAKPPVRKLARDLGVDLTMLTGTGPAGSITREDIQAAASQPADLLGLATAQPVEPGGLDRAAAMRLAFLPREERIAIRGVRKHTAAAMASSAFTAPHVTEFLQIDISQTMSATVRLRSLPEFDQVRVTPLLLVAKALLVAANRHPLVNSSWDEAAQEIVVKHYVNLGIATATDRGLVVPSVKDAHALSLLELARAISTVTEVARAGKSSPGDLRGGTITITNVGVFGVDTGTPIISPGEAAILAFGQVRDAPWVVDGQLAVRKVCTLALSFDHRIIDGDVGSAALREVGAMLTDPLRMLAWS